jgi:hypothetical protein|tara:strand:- start:268 stop:492 length:225 start_codon:yes stop_codon:yes gene_type:complete
MKYDLKKLKKLDRYRENLLVSDDFVFSYLTNVARICHITKTIQPLGWWSSTTSKHINYVGKHLNYEVLKLKDLR